MYRVLLNDGYILLETRAFLRTFRMAGNRHDASCPYESRTPVYFVKMALSNPYERGNVYFMMKIMCDDL